MDLGTASAEASEGWWEMRAVYEADLPDDWAILLLASPDWESFRGLDPAE